VHLIRSLRKRLRLVHKPPPSAPLQPDRGLAESQCNSPQPEPVRQTAAPIYLGDYTAVTKTVHGQIIYVDTRDISLTPRILLDGEWEASTTKALLDIVRPGMTVVDVGANIGWYTLLASSRVGSTGRVVSFEANARLVDLLRKSISVNGFFNLATVENKVVYSKAGPTSFKIFNQYLGSGSLFVSDETAIAYHDTLREVTVEAITLDDYFPPSQVINLIRVDAEGSEPHILRGAKRIIADNSDIIVMMEFAPAMINASVRNLDDFFDEIASYGLEIWTIESDGSLLKASTTALKQVSLCDILLKRPV
jgi:FkbM family methyltransferase